ncbi:hypothetical protein M1L60_22360 [Actinoplanes sp. TRM 88003]|uniref:TipAS antibiotic-recognition domain-containing protein n=1 Tax=Paractinoplanes aksuensis TaxID=2939490 RepID=A0ABT1DUG9_9ACTN|nr:hypothetical protein [Actinoplanes aksuensis]MCO8273341.1 hypothetical protein [Actinoplanes aksuensis]
MTEPMRRVLELGEWHAEWMAKWVTTVEFHQGRYRPDGDHLRDMLLEAPGEARREFYERADQILGAQGG